jgi:hypothetical protein
VAAWYQIDRDGKIEDLLARQIDLLAERRQALILSRSLVSLMVRIRSPRRRHG